MTEIEFKCSADNRCTHGVRELLCQNSHYINDYVKYSMLHSFVFDNKYVRSVKNWHDMGPCKRSHLDRGLDITEKLWKFSKKYDAFLKKDEFLKPDSMN